MTNVMLDLLWVQTVCSSSTKPLLLVKAKNTKNLFAGENFLVLSLNKVLC